MYMYLNSVNVAESNTSFANDSEKYILLTVTEEQIEISLRQISKTCF